MDTKSTHTQALSRHTTSRLPRNSTTLPKSAEQLAAQFEAFLVAQRDADSLMDEERGQRIKALRDRRHLSQPAVVEGLDKLARRKVVTLRGYQTWEAGGGIRWENVKVLAAFHQVEPDYILTGQEPEAPDLLDSLNGDTRKLEERLDRIERKLDELLADKQPSKPSKREAPARRPLPRRSPRKD